MILIIGAIAVVFTLYLGSGGGFSAAPGMGTVVQVGDRRYDTRRVRDVRANIENQYRQALGDNYDPKAADSFLNEQAAGTILQSALLVHVAEEVGLVASDEEVREYLKSIPGFQDESGQIQKETLTNFAERQFGSVKRFEEVLRDEVLQQKLRSVIWQSVDVSEEEARQALRYGQEEIEIAFVAFDGSKRPEGVEADEEAVAAILAEESTRLQEAYDERRAEFDKPEQVKARHILIRKGDDDEAKTAARAKLEGIQTRIAEGEDFAELATEFSDDSSKERGGDLGFFPRGAMVKEFEEVAFSLEPSTVSDIVETTFGFHLIRVDEKKAEERVPFEQAREQIARDLALNEATAELAKKDAELLAERIAGGESLVEAARADELTVERPDALRRRPDGFIPKLGASPELLRAAFALTEEKPTDGKVYEVGDRKFVLVQLLERRSPSDADLEASIPGERDRLLQDRRQQTQTAWLDEVRDELTASGELIYDLSALE